MPSIVLQCTHVPSGARRAYSPAPWLTVRWSSLASVQWEMLYASVKHGAPPFTLAGMMGLIVAGRTFSSTARETGAAGVSGFALSRRCPKPSRGDGLARRWRDRAAAARVVGGRGRDVRLHGV